MKQWGNNQINRQINRLICFASIWVVIVGSSGFAFARRVINFDDVADGTKVTQAYQEQGVVFRCLRPWLDNPLVYNTKAFAYQDSHALSGNNVMGGRFFSDRPAHWVHWLSFPIAYGVARFVEPADYVSLYGVGGPFQILVYDQENNEFGPFLSHVVQTAVSHPTGCDVNFLEIHAGELGTSGALIRKIKFGSIYAGNRDDLTYFDDLTFIVNEAPTADAGPDQTVDEGDTVSLDGSNSSDPDDGDVLTYQWTQKNGDPVVLTDADKAQATFEAPDVGPTGVSLTFELTVTDTYGGETSTDECIVTITWSNRQPTVDAGDDQTANEGDTVTLNGSESDDSDIPSGDSITYEWEQIGGPVVMLSDPTAKQTTFWAPDVGAGGSALTFQLTVTDSGNLKDTDTCVVNVTFMNIPPTTDAGDDQTVDEGNMVTLDASRSSDPDAGESISYRWKQVDGTPSVTFSDPTAQQPTFVAPAVDINGTTLTFELTVTDGGGLHKTDRVVVTVEDNGIEIYGCPADAVTTTCSTGDPIGLVCGAGAHLTALDTSVDPDTLPTEDRPADLIYGLIGTRIKCDNPRDAVTLTIFFQTQVPDDYTVFKYGYKFDETYQQYDANESWYDYSDYVTFSQDRTQVTLTLIDAGAGDHNRAPDGVIVDPAGIAYRVVQSYDDDTTEAPSGGGGGCFIKTAANGLGW